MKTIYLDSDFICHVTNDGTRTAVETDYFDGKCDAFIECYRFVPDGSSWTREDGVVFSGEMIAPYKDYAIASARQEQYEEDRIVMEDMQNALNIMGVSVNE